MSKKLPKNRTPEKDLNELFLGIRDKLSPDEINRNRKLMGLPSQLQAPKSIGDIKKSVDALIDRIEKSKLEQYPKPTGRNQKIYRGVDGYYAIEHPEKGSGGRVAHVFQYDPKTRKAGKWITGLQKDGPIGGSYPTKRSWYADKKLTPFNSE